MSIEPLNFESIKSEERGWLDDTQVDILTIFETAINSSPNPDIDGKAKRFVSELLALAPEAISGRKPDEFAHTTWQLLINAASCIPS